jgi:hypothetical protein
MFYFFVYVQTILSLCGDSETCLHLYNVFEKQIYCYRCLWLHLL